MRQARGFSLLELLLVCAIIGILSGVGILTLRSAIQTTRLNEGGAQFAADLQRARSGSQRFNRSSSLTLDGSPAIKYSLTINGQTMTRSLPANIQIKAENAATVTYGAPFGEIAGATGLTFTVSLQGHSKTRKVKVLGTTGKVYTQ